MIDFHALPLWVNALLFFAVAPFIWRSGVRLAHDAEVIAHRTRLGKAFVGALVLGGITSLPELVTASTAAALGNAPLAVNNVLGGVAMQLGLLVLADAVVRDRALSIATAHSGLLLQGVLLLLLLAVTAIGIVVGEPAPLPVGLWTTLLLVMAVLGFRLLRHYESDIEWELVEEEVVYAAEARIPVGALRKPRQADQQERSLPAALRSAAGAALVIFICGFLTAQIGDALAIQTGFGSNFVGVLLLPIITSLPEMSTTIAAARLGQFEMAFSNVYGANLIDLASLFLVDLLYAGGPILNRLGTFSIFAVLLAMVMTAIYLAGLIERRNRTILGLGIDSILVLCCYLGGIGILYTLR